MCIDIYAMVSLLNHLYLDGGLETKEDINFKKTHQKHKMQT
jgi:hypothetical protein